MAARSAAIRQNDARRIFRAALLAGFESVRMVIHPDGRIEASAALSEASVNDGPNSWDEVLR